MEENVQRSRQTDSVSTDSYSFSIFQAYFKSPDKNANKWGVSYFYGRMLILMEKPGHCQQEPECECLYRAHENKNEQVRVNATFRSLQVVNPSVTNGRQKRAC
jgi:hypothetical protein